MNIYEKQIRENLKKYQDKIMKYTLGNDVDQENIKYTFLYEYEWRDALLEICYSVNRLNNYGIKISDEGLLYLILASWGDVMTFQTDDLNMGKLKTICGKILNEIQ